MNFWLIVIIVAMVFVVMKKVATHGIVLVTAANAKELVKDSMVTILDVRTPGEYSEGHLKAAKLIPVSELSSRITELASFKDHTILVYCHSGNRSASASQILKKNGFTKVSNLQGGITAWKNAGNKTVKGD